MDPVVDAPSRRRIVRARDDRVLGGVCGGLGSAFGVDPVWFRIGFVALAFAAGSGLLLYLVLWLVMPLQREDEPSSAPIGGGAPVVGAVFVAVGLMLLAANLGTWFDLAWLGKVLWPLLLVAVGAVLLMGVMRDDKR